MTRRGQNVVCFPQSLLVTKTGQVPKFHSCDLGTCFNNVIQAVFIFQFKAGKPADEGETQETFEKELIKRQRITGDRKRVQFAEKMNSLLPSLHNVCSVHIKFQLLVKKGA